ncbi:T9SS type A sorting domain-containing protein [Saccharicrinis carchari]|nr:T9SS type A sorting domain-containing protein [Saccharicrinis carchari]
MIKSLLSVFVAFFILNGAIAQSWVQISSDDLDIPFSETLIKHNNDWYLGTAGGVFKTSDQGANWTLTNNNLYSAFGRLRIEGFFVSGERLIGVNRWAGVVSTTNGSNWVAATGLPQNKFMPKDIALVGTKLVTIVYDYNADTYHLYASVDDGLSWIKGNVISSINSNPRIFSDGHLAYITHTNSIGSDEFIATTSDGMSAGPVNLSPAFSETSIEKIVFAEDYMIVSGQGVFLRYDMLNGGWTNLGSSWSNGIGFVSLCANETGRLYASIFEGDYTLGVHFSDDYGDTWNKMTVNTTRGAAFAMGIYATGSEFMASFIDEGVHYSSDAGQTMVKRNNGLGGSDLEELFVANGNMITSLFISGVYGSENDGGAWGKWNAGLPSDVIKRVYGYLNIGTTILANYSTSPGDEAAPEKVVRSVDNGKTWSVLANPAGYDNLKLIGKNGTNLFAISSAPSGLLMSGDNGNSWTDISGSLPSGFSPRLIKGSGSLTFMAGTNDNNKLQIYSSINLGTSWTSAMEGIVSDELAELRSNDEILMVSGDDKIFVQLKYANSNNKLAIWNVDGWQEVVASGLDYIDFRAMAYNNGALFVSHWNEGIHMSTDNGNSFTLTSGLPDGIAANVFAFDNGIAYAGSSRGIWKYSLATHVDEKAINATALLNPNPARDVVRISMDATSVNVYAVSGQLVKQVRVVDRQFSVSDLNEGMYVVVIKSSQGTLKTKLIVK